VETRRKLYGEWISNDGVIYTNFDRARHVFQPTTLDKIYYAPGEDEDPNKTFSFLNLANMYAGMDFGTQQGTGIVYVAKYEDRFYVTKEYFSNKPTDSTATHSAFIHRNVHCLKIYCDHAPELLNNYKAMRHTNMVLAPKGSGSIRQGIDTIQRLLAEDKLFIHHKCKRLIAELESYVWKPNSEDIPLDKDICLVDALRYVITPLAGKPNDLFAFVASTDTSVRSEPLVLAAPRAERGAVIGMRADGTWVYEND
jgi:phage terminase large subunit